MPAVRLSRYEFAPVEVDDEGRTFLDVPDPLPRSPRRDDRRTTIGDGDSMESVAWRSFLEVLDRKQDIGPSRFFWVVGEINVVTDLSTYPALPSGQTFRVPTVDTLMGDYLAPPRFYDPSRAS